MKKHVLAALAVTTAIATPAVAAPPFGSSGTDTSTITATIALDCTVDAPLGGAVAINATTAIGDSKVQCNDPDGYNVQISSFNSGVLDDASNVNNATTIPYTLTITGAGTYNLATPQNLPHGPPNTLGVAGLSLPTSVNVGTPSGPAFAGAYSDIITYTITPN